MPKQMVKKYKQRPFLSTTVGNDPYRTILGRRILGQMLEVGDNVVGWKEQVKMVIKFKKLKKQKQNTSN